MGVPVHFGINTYVSAQPRIKARTASSTIRQILSASLKRCFLGSGSLCL